MRVTCERCLRRYDVPDATVKGRKIRARCKCGARVVVQDEERAARSSAGGSQTTGSIQRPVRWFVDITSWEPIAMDLRQLVRAFDGGRIDADTLVWRKGMPDWRRLRDVPELAERLMGADAAKPAPDPEPMRADAPGARQADKQPERSRTPPANYSVPPLQGRGSSPPVERISVLPSGGRADHEERGAVTLPGGSMPATPVGGYLSPAPPQLSARPERRSVPMPAGARSGRPPMTGDSPRTITQTGLAPAPDPAHRLVQPAPPAADAPITEEPAATRAGAAAVVAPRPSRATPSPRRTPSNDETPAQKPSSLSVPSEDLAPSRTRTKHLVALGGLVLGLGLIYRGSLSSEPAQSNPAANVAAPAALAPLAPAEPPQPELRVENRNALAPEPAAAESAVAESAVAESAKAEAEMAPAALPPAAPARAVRPALPAAAKPVAPQPKAAVLDIRPSDGSAASAGGLAARSAPVTGRGELGAPATPPPPPVTPPLAAAEPRPSAGATAAPAAPPSTAVPPRATPPAAAPPAAPAPAAPPSAAPPSAAPPSAAPPSAAPPSAGPPPRATPPAAAAPAAPAPAAPPAAAAPPSAATPAPAPFDLQRAKVQLGIAAFKASTCGPLGSVRGAGDVTVVIEPFGRVTRVTHSNPAFVGNPVGACVTQAYQQVQVAPFSGGPQTLTSSFVVP